MAAIANLRAENLTVEPGKEATCEISVQNTGTIVEQFQLTPLGDAADWMTVEPETLSLFPGAEATAVIKFAPPRSSEVVAGSVPFAVKVTASTDPDDATVEESTIEVAPFFILVADLLPNASNGRRAAKHRVGVENRGNAPLLAAFEAVDPTDELSLGARPANLSLGPGQASVVQVRVRPIHLIILGQKKTHPFQVVAAAPGVETQTLNGTMTQKPLLPKWALAVAALAAIVLVWLALVKPQIKSAAKTEALNASASGTQSAAAAKTAADAAAAKAAAAQAAAQAAASSAGATTTTGPTTTTSTSTTLPPAAPPPAAPQFVTNPTDGRVDVVAAPGAVNQGTYGMQKGNTLSITDLVLENVRGSSGEVHIQRLTPKLAPQDLLVLRLDSFRDQSYHFTTPMIFSDPSTLQVQVFCDSNQIDCNVGAYFTGSLKQPAS